MSEKKESSIKPIVKDTLALVIITLVAAVLLGLIREITAGPIAKREEEDKQKAYLAVFEQAASVEESKDVPELLQAVKDAPEILTSVYKDVTVDEACLAKDADGNLLGYIITVTDKKGYGGDIKMVFGFSLQSGITGIEFLKISETAGFGLEAEKDPEWRKQFYNVRISEFAVTKNDTGWQSEIDALSGATITSNAVTQGINGGLCFVKYLIRQGIGGAQ